MRHKGCKNREFKGLQITYPAAGFQNDAVRLIQKFLSTKSIRFDEFVTMWKESNLTLMYVGRAGIREKRELLEEAFAILIKYIMPPYNLQVRVGAVYALYCLYHTQRLTPNTRIRIPLSCWPNFCHLQKEVLDQQHLDSAYIIRQLIADRAFVLCAYPSMLSVDEVYVHEETDRPYGSSGATAHSTSLGEGTGLLVQIQDEDSIGQLHAVHEKYHELKCQMNANQGGNPDQPSGSVNLIKPGIAEAILGIISHSDSEVTDEGSNEEGIGESAERAKKLKALKAAASASMLGQRMKPYRAQLQDPDESTKTGPAEAEEGLTESGFLVKRRGRPASKPPGVNIASERTNSFQEVSSSSAEDIYSPVENTVKKHKRKRGSDAADEDYIPSDQLDLTGKLKTLPTRRRQSNMSFEENEETEGSGNAEAEFSRRKRSRSSTGSEKSMPVDTSEISVGQFVAICPDDRSPNQPVIGKVIAVKSLDKIEVVIYKGSINSPWTPVTAVNKDDSMEGKPLVETISVDKVIMTGLNLTKGKRLPERIKKDLLRVMQDAIEK